MNYSAQLAVVPQSDRRTSSRRVVNFAAKVRELGAVAVSVRVSDISPGGCRLSNCDLDEGAEIWLKMPGLNPVRAKVMWTAKGEAGCEFYGAVDVDDALANDAQRP